MSGFLLYRGPSMLDGSPIIAVATFASENAKTGAMVQTFIMREDVEPHTALKTGADASVCGDCKHRPANGGSCYVVVHQAPLSVYRAYKRGRYTFAVAHAARAAAGLMVRLGTYGDPAAVPARVWEDFLTYAKGHTGYTHQWANMGEAQAMRFRPLVMASADTIEERREAIAKLWRTFRVRTANEPRDTGEFICPASEEAGKRATCATCGACNGAQAGKVRQASPVIIVHGAKGKTRAFERTRAV